MDQESLFERENQVIDENTVIVEDKENQSNPLHKAFCSLFDNYKRVLGQFSRIIRINDRQQRELLEARDELRILNATKDKFFTIIAHDLKGPINSFLNMSDLLMRGLDRMSKEEIQENAVYVNERGENLMKLMENLLHWAGLQMQRIEFNPQLVPVNSLVQQVIYALEAQAGEKQIAIDADFPDDISVQADPNMLNTILRNLISNAIKFTPEEGRISIQAGRVSGAVEISVTDDGVGISEVDQAKLFRIDIIHSDVGTRKETGTGLGLILCKELVEKHNGTVAIKSDKGKGTTVTLTFPD